MHFLTCKVSFEFLEELQSILLNKLYFFTRIHRETLFLDFLLNLVYPRKYSPTASANIAIAPILELLLQILGTPLQTLGGLQILETLVQTLGTLVRTL